MAAIGSCFVSSSSLRSDAHFAHQAANTLMATDRVFAHIGMDILHPIGRCSSVYSDYLLGGWRVSGH